MIVNNLSKMKESARFLWYQKRRPDIYRIYITCLRFRLCGYA